MLLANNVVAIQSAKRVSCFDFQTELSTSLRAFLFGSIGFFRLGFRELFLVGLVGELFPPVPNLVEKVDWHPLPFWRCCYWRLL